MWQPFHRKYLQPVIAQVIVAQTVANRCKFMPPVVQLSPSGSLPKMRQPGAKLHTLTGNVLHLPMVYPYATESVV